MTTERHTRTKVPSCGEVVGLIHSVVNQSGEVHLVTIQSVGELRTSGEINSHFLHGEIELQVERNVHRLQLLRQFEIASSDFVFALVVEQCTFHTEASNQAHVGFRTDEPARTVLTFERASQCCLVEGGRREIITSSYTEAKIAKSVRRKGCGEEHHKC